MYMDDHWSAGCNYEKKGNKPNVPQENKLHNIHTMDHNVTSKDQLFCLFVLNVLTWKDFEDTLFGGGGRGGEPSC